MKKIGMYLGFVFLGLMTFSQQPPNNSEEEETKKDKKESRKEFLQQNLDTIKTLIENKTYALEADMLRGRYDTYNIFQDNNFIKVMGDEVIIQSANATRVGANSLGGLTVRGRLLTHEIQPVDNGVNVVMTVSSVILGNFNVYLTVSANGNAQANLRGNFGLYTTFIGEFVETNDLNQFQGIVRF
ncbi:protein of unknown function [Ekhidna lutea]|uniref:DUF4251 domain-containing protein n=1 Tax=Ekhidna lutea TaxID=447679 RepID=A0A239HRB2_EKHLU|nr:DUF4251 domain-containing protein [Ekhidna lutea]SNS83887.1 protein of unknown function [Ekhidna lutea]